MIAGENQISSIGTPGAIAFDQNSEVPAEHLSQELFTMEENRSEGDYRVNFGILSALPFHTRFPFRDS